MTPLHMHFLYYTIFPGQTQSLQIEKARLACKRASKFLFTDFQLFYDTTVTLNVMFFQIIQQTTTLAYHL
jgi:ABC-type polar amino acid transport system ATPase subunit